MPGRKRHLFRLLVPFGVFAVALATMLGRRGDDWEYELADQAVEVDEAPQSAPPAPHRKRRRYAVAAAFTTLFFAGAAFTAGAGDQMVRLADEDAAALEAANADPAAETPAPDAAADPAAAPAPEQSAAPEAAAPEAATPEAAVPEAAAPAATPEAAAPEAAAPAAAAARRARSGGTGRRARTQRSQGEHCPGARRPLGQARSEARRARQEAGHEVGPQARRRPGSRAGDRAGARRADDLAQPGASRPDARLRAPAAIVRPQAEDHGEAARRRLGRGARRASRRRSPRLGSGDAAGARPPRRAARRPSDLAWRTRALGPHRVRRPGGRPGRPVPLGRPAGARDRVREGKGAADEAAARGRGRADLPGRPRGSRGRPCRRPRRRPARLSGEAVRQAHGVEPVLRPPDVRAPGRRLGTHVRSCRGRRRSRRHVDRRAPAAGRHHRGRGPLDPAAAERAAAAPGDLAARPGRSSFPLRDHGDHIHIGY